MKILKKLMILLVLAALIIGCSKEPENNYLGNLKVGYTMKLDDKEVPKAKFEFFYGRALTKYLNQYYSAFSDDYASIVDFNIEKDINDLLFEYENRRNINIEDIIDFHLKFERVHPFGDGNGRVGRAIMFKECLRKNIVPFVILDQHKAYYLRGLREYDRDKNFLIDTCLNEQDIYKDLCKQLLNMNFENGKTR